MSRFVIPATNAVNGMGEWLKLMMNDHIAAKKSILTADEEEHKGALVLAQCYVFAMKAASDAIFSEESGPEWVKTPQKKVLWMVQKMVDELDALDNAPTAEPTQLSLIEPDGADATQ